MTAVDARQPGYHVELDAWLRRPDVRITRALTTSSWSTSQDLLGALELDPSDWPEYYRTISRLFLSGHIERTREGNVDRYRLIRAIDPPPRERPAGPPLEPGREGEERGAWFFWRGGWRAL